MIIVTRAQDIALGGLESFKTFKALTDRHRRFHRLCLAPDGDELEATGRNGRQSEGPSGTVRLAARVGNRNGLPACRMPGNKRRGEFDSADTRPYSNDSRSE